MSMAVPWVPTLVGTIRPALDPRWDEGLSLFVPTKVGTYQGRFRGGSMSMEVPWVPTKVGTHPGPPEPTTARATLRRIYPLPQGAKKG